MYLKELELTNFRKYESLTVEFKKGLNVLIGENDSGKTAIVDAVRYLLNTKSFESVRFEPKDFYQKKSLIRAESLSIIGVFSDFTDEEAANFLEWGYFNERKFELRLLLKVNLQNNNRITWDLKAGPENAEIQMDGNARELLQVTYLKPLRDAETELTPGYRSRLAQILQSHKGFQKTKNDSGQFEQHQLEKTYQIIVHGNHQLRPQPETVELAIEGKAACSHFSHLDHDKTRDLSLLKVNIESGRKHQIRVHAASIGFPVLGDRLHGEQMSQVEQESDLPIAQRVNLQLCAVALKFNCPLSNIERDFVLPTAMCPQLSQLSEAI